MTQEFYLQIRTKLSIQKLLRRRRVKESVITIIKIQIEMEIKRRLNCEENFKLQMAISHLLNKELTETRIKEVGVSKLQSQLSRYKLR
jgi:hypothetical protein